MELLGSTLYLLVFFCIFIFVLMLLMFILGGMGNIMAILGTRSMVMQAKRQRGVVGEYVYFIILF